MFRSWMPVSLNYLLLGSIAIRRYHTTFVVLMCSATRVRRINNQTRGGIANLRKIQMRSMLPFHPPISLKCIYLNHEYV